MAFIDINGIINAIQSGQRADASINRGPLEIGLSGEQGGPSSSDYNVASYAKSITVNPSTLSGFLWGSSLWGNSKDKVV